MTLISYRPFRPRNTVTCDRCGQAGSCRFQRSHPPATPSGDSSASAVPIGNGEVRKLVDLPIPTPNKGSALTATCGTREGEISVDHRSNVARSEQRRTAGRDDAEINVRTGEASYRLARSGRCHVALDCIFKEFRVRLDVQCLHHPVLVKRHRSRLYVDDIRHFFH